MNKVLALRIIHGMFSLYFILCLVYLYYAALFLQINLVLLIAVVSLGIEGFIVFVLNKGDCPLMHIQRKIGDTTPFFALLFPATLAKQAIPTFAKLTWIGVAILVVRVLLSI